MAVQTSESNSPSSAFANPEWQPLCIVGGCANGRADAQVAVSILGASIVPDRQRLIVVLWKPNLTCELIATSGRLAITLVSDALLPHFERLGIESGRDEDKLAGLPFETTGEGVPYFPDGAGWLEARVLQSLDLGDAMAFVAGVTSEHPRDAVEPLTWKQAMDRLPKELVKRHTAKFEADADDARPKMRWFGGSSDE